MGGENTPGGKVEKAEMMRVEMKKRRRGGQVVGRSSGRKVKCAATHGKVQKTERKRVRNKET
jgi:hypothetical protein